MASAHRHAQGENAIRLIAFEGAHKELVLAVRRVQGARQDRHPLIFPDDETLAAAEGAK